MKSIIRNRFSLIDFDYEIEFTIAISYSIVKSSITILGCGHRCGRSRDGGEYYKERLYMYSVLHALTIRMADLETVELCQCVLQFCETTVQAARLDCSEDSKECLLEMLEFLQSGCLYSSFTEL